MATVKFPSEMPTPTTIKGTDKVLMSNGDNGESMAPQFDQLKQYLSITGIDLNPSDYPPGSELPTGPLGENRRITNVIPGSYTWNGNTYTVPDGYTGTLFWNGSSWSLTTQELPQAEIDKTNTIKEKTEKVTTEEAVLDYSTPLTSERILPDGNSFVDIDRPDKDLDKSLLILDEDSKIKIELRSLTTLMDDYDRPDLFGSILIDEQGRVLAKELFERTENTVPEPVVNSFTEFTHQTTPLDAYPYALDYDMEIARWDALMSGNEDYITKTQVGVSSFGDYPIYRYDFKPENVSGKVLVTSGTHGQEKNVIVANYRWFEYLVNNWFNHPMTEWARFNVHFVVLPIFSPSSFNPNAFAPEGSIYENGDRKVFETPPIPCTWTRSGTTATITINVGSFPPGTGFDPISYFSNPGLAGKMWIGFISSSDDSVIETGEGAVVQSVVNGYTITINVANTGATSGVCDIIVPVDPNRDTPTQISIWENFTPTTSNINGYPRVPHDNKGTRPFALKETAVFTSVMNEGLDAAILLHSGAANYYFSPGYGMDDDEIFNFIFERMKTFSGSDYTHPVSNRLTQGSYGYSEYAVPTFTLEWLGAAAPNTAKDATDLIRFIFNSILMVSRFYIK